jgi:uncharacterized protein YcbX
MRVTALNVYPVKSCAATPLHEAELGARGILHDREFMVVDTNRRFLTQREQPRLALIKPVRTDSTLTLSGPGMAPLTVEPVEDQRHEVSIWRDRVVAADQGDRVAEWLSTYLGTGCRLVGLPDDVVRPVDPDFASQPGDQVGLADGFPVLLISEESLADLNRRLAQPLPMNRFRPNVVISGAGVPYAEDGWAEIRIGELAFSVVKACARCVTTTTDQVTAQRGPEPLGTLATYRRVARGVLFGQNLIHAEAGLIAVGDSVRVCREAVPPVFLR